MNVALIQKNHHRNVEPQQQQAGTQLVCELDNVAHGLKHFANQLQTTSSMQARFALTVQLKVWILNKPTLQTLLAQYLDEVEHTQQLLHLDPGGHDESIFSLSEQLVFLSAVFDQESKLVEQFASTNSNLVLCD